MTHEQEKAILETTDKLYELCNVFGIGDDLVREWKENIIFDIKEQTGLEIE